MAGYSWDWAEFAPKVSSADKRDREAVLVKGVKLVKKNFNELGLASLFSVPVVNKNREVQKIVHIYPPNSPIEVFVNENKNQHFMKSLTKAIEDTQRWALDLWDLKDKGELDETGIACGKFKEMTGVLKDVYVNEHEDEYIMVKPEKPIIILNTDEMSVYFGGLLKNLYALEGTKVFKLWSKRNRDGSVDLEKRATKLEIYDEKAEEILPRDNYIGRGSGGPNIGMRMKLVSAYLLDKLGIDHNKHAKIIPRNYSDIDIDFDNFEEFLTNKFRTEKCKPLRKKKMEIVKEEVINSPEGSFVPNSEELLDDMDNVSGNGYFNEEINSDTFVQCESNNTIKLQTNKSRADGTIPKKKIVSQQVIEEKEASLESAMPKVDSSRNSTAKNFSDCNLYEEENTVRPIKKGRLQKRKSFEPSDSCKSSSSDTDSEEELKRSRKSSRKKRSSSKHSREESEMFQKTFMKMMRKTMKSVLAQQMG